MRGKTNLYMLNSFRRSINLPVETSSHYTRKVEAKQFEQGQPSDPLQDQLVNPVEDQLVNPIKSVVKSLSLKDMQDAKASSVGSTDIKATARYAEPDYEAMQDGNVFDDYAPIDYTPTDEPPTLDQHPIDELAWQTADADIQPAIIDYATATGKQVSNGDYRKARGILADDGEPAEVSIGRVRDNVSMIEAAKETVTPAKVKKSAKPAETKARARNEMFDAIAQYLFRLRLDDAAAMDANVKRIGMIKKQLLAQNATPQDIPQFVSWYKRKYPDAAPPTDKAKVALHYSHYVEARKPAIAQQAVISTGPMTDAMGMPI